MMSGFKLQRSKFILGKRPDARIKDQIYELGLRPNFPFRLPSLHRRAVVAVIKIKWILQILPEQI